MRTVDANQIVIVLGVIGNDIHVVANRVLYLQLTEMGFHIVNLSVNNQPQNFVRAAKEHKAAAVLVSSLNGEAEHWCHNFRHLFEEAGIGDTILFIGGNLSIGSTSDKDIEKQFMGYGFNRVYSRRGDPQSIGLDLLDELS